MAADPWSSAVQADAAKRHEYSRRCTEVFWTGGSQDTASRAHIACLARGGPNHGQCMLNPGHHGPHYGPTYDEWGPIGPREWKNDGR